MRILAPFLALTLSAGAASDAAKTAALPGPKPAPDARRWVGADGVMKRLAEQAEAAAKRADDTALARLYRLTNIERLVHRPEIVRPALDVIAKTRDPLVRDHAQYLIARDDRRRGELEVSRKTIAELGFLTGGLLIGPFDNATGRGHDEIYAPEISFDTPVRGKSHAVAWNALEGLVPDGHVELARLVSPSNEATAYVAAVLESKRRTKIALRTGSIDQLRVFVNGLEVYAIDTRRDAHPDQDAIPVELVAGDNLVLFKSSWVAESGRLFARATAPRGGAAAGVSWVYDRERIAAAYQRAKDAPATKKATHAVVGVTDGIQRAVERARRGQEGDTLALRADLYAITSSFDRRKLPTPPESDLESALRLLPEDPMVRFFYAHRVRARDPNLALHQWEATLESDPKFVPALLELADAARRSGRVLEAHARIEAAIAADPTLTASHVARAQLGNDALDEGPAALLRLREAPGFDRTPGALVDAARMARAQGDRNAARRDVRRALALDRDRPTARLMAVNLALDTAEVDDALEHLGQAIQLRPFSVHLVLQRARILAGRNALDEALAQIAAAKRIAPDDPTSFSLEAELLLLSGKKEAAIAAYDEALARDPQQPDVRRHRRALSGQRDELEDEFTADAKKLLTAPVSEEEKQWGAAYLLDRKAVRLFENGKSTKFAQYVIRLTNPRLEDALRAQQIPYSPSREVVEVLSAERLRPSGEIEKAATIRDTGPSGKVSGMYIDQRSKTIVFNDLSAGDLVHVRYRIDSIGENIFGGFFGDVEAVQAGVPKRDVEYTVITPKSRPLYAASIRTKDPIVEERGDRTYMTWKYATVDALDIEPYAPPYPQLGSMVSVSTYENWAALGKWYARLFSDQLELDKAARDAGKRAVKGAKTDEEKIRRLYDYVVKNTRYVGIELGIHGWKPYKASEVHRRRYGDCKDKATLLSALLRDNGVDATITLVRTSDRGVLPEDHATMWAFNHAITYIPSQKLFLDPTAEFSGSTELPYQDQDAMALIVHPNGDTKLVRIPKSGPKDNRNESQYVAKIGRDTSLTMTGEERFFGARASQLRQELEEQKTRKTILERQLGQILAGAKITSLDFSDLSDIEAPVKYDYSFTVPNYGRVDQGRLLLPVALYQHQVATAYAQLAERKTALHINHPWTTTNEIRYVLPEGSTVEQLPEGVTIESKHVSLVQVVEKTPDGFLTRDTVSLKTKTIPPEDYGEFRNTCLAIDRALERGVVIKL